MTNFYIRAVSNRGSAHVFTVEPMPPSKLNNLFGFWRYVTPKALCGAWPMERSMEGTFGWSTASRRSYCKKCDAKAQKAPKDWVTAGTRPKPAEEDHPAGDAPSLGGRTGQISACFIPDET